MMILARIAEKKVPMVRMTNTCVERQHLCKGSQSCHVPLGAQSCHRPSGKYVSPWQRYRFSGTKQCHLYRGLQGEVEGDRTDCVAVFDQHLRHRLARSPKLDGWRDLPRGLHDLTSDEQCNAMGAVSYTGNADTLSRALEVVGSVSPFGSLPTVQWFRLRQTVSQGL